MLRKMVIDLEVQLRELFERLKVSDDKYTMMRAEKSGLRNDCDDLRKQLIAQDQRMTASGNIVKELDEKQSVWRKEQEEEQECFERSSKVR